MSRFDQRLADGMKDADFRDGFEEAERECEAFAAAARPIYARALKAEGLDKGYLTAEEFLESLDG